MANFGKILKTVAGLTTAAVGAVVAIKANKGQKDYDSTLEPLGEAPIEDEELKEMAEMEAAEESEPEEVEPEEDNG